DRLVLEDLDRLRHLGELVAALGSNQHRQVAARELSHGGGEKAKPPNNIALDIEPYDQGGDDERGDGGEDQDGKAEAHRPIGLAGRLRREGSRRLDEVANQRIERRRQLAIALGESLDAGLGRKNASPQVEDI